MQLQSSTPSATKAPQVSLPSNSHLDPGAYVRGTHPITIGQHVLIHPRAHLLSLHAPLIIEDGCIISEKCVLGGPPEAKGNSSTADSTSVNRDLIEDDDDPGRPTIIERATHLHANVAVNHGATIKAFTVLESNSSVGSEVKVGSHTKICANISITRDVPEWTVIWGSNQDQKRRSRQACHPENLDDTYMRVEKERLRAMDRDRDGTILFLKAAAAKALSTKKK